MEEGPRGTCRTCHYWDPELVEEEVLEAEKRGTLYEGKCRRYPPAPVPWRDVNEDCLSNAYWTRTSPGDWCGEWGPRRARFEVVAGGAPGEAQDPSTYIVKESKE